MSALGQKPTYALHKVRSALPPIATAKTDFRTRSIQLGMSALGQKWTLVRRRLLDQLIGAKKNRLRDCNIERLCRSRIYDQFELRRALNRKCRRVRTFQDT